MLADVLRDFRRNGLELSPEKQARLRQINEQLTTIGQKFDSNIASSVGKIKIKPAQLAGLYAPDYVTKHPPSKEGLVEISTDYPRLLPVRHLRQGSQGRARALRPLHQSRRRRST